MKNNFIYVLFSKHTENYENSSFALFCLKKKIYEFGYFTIMYKIRKFNRKIKFVLLSNLTSLTSNIKTVYMNFKHFRKIMLPLTI